MTLNERYTAWEADEDHFSPPLGSKRKDAELNARIRDLAAEAITKLNMVRSCIDDAVRPWCDGFCPSFTCSEAESLLEALQILEFDQEFTDNFMTSHASTDDDSDDLHETLEDATGRVISWARKEAFNG